MTRSGETVATFLLLALVITVPAVLAECADHWPCCVCLTNLCPRSRDPTNSTCQTCAATNLALLTSKTCNCLSTEDFEPYCSSSRFACDVRSDRCVPRPGGRFPSAGDCIADGCNQPAPAPPKPGPPPGPVPGGLWLPPIFADNMVLQAESSSIQGHAVPGSTVTLVASPARTGFPVKVVTGQDGMWTASFDNQTSNAAATNITVSSRNGSIALSGVLWGDVVLCSGQSNSK